MPGTQTIPHSALLVMDVQQGIVKRFGEDKNLLDRLNVALAAARQSQLPVLFVVVKFREGYPEVSSHNQSFRALKEGQFPLAESDADTAVHPAVAPQPGEIVVTKRRVSAFSGSDLEVILRSQSIRSLVLTGIATSGVVLSTLRAAADMDYELTVLSDCCADGDAEVH